MPGRTAQRVDSVNIAELAEEIEAAWRDAQAPASSNIARRTYDDEGVAAYFTGRSWRGHTAKQLRRLSFAPGILTHDAFAYFLAAYMKADVEQPEVADTIVESLLYALDPGAHGDNIDRAGAIFGLLNDCQRRVVTEYVSYINGREAGLYDDECRRILPLLAG